MRGFCRKQHGVVSAVLITAVVGLAVGAFLPMMTGSGLEPSAAKPSSVVMLTDETFEHHTQASSGATSGDWFVLFHSPRCQHCQAMLPIWERLAVLLKGVTNVATLDVSRNTATAGRFGVESIPSMTLFHYGKMFVFDKERTVENLERFARVGHETTPGRIVPMEKSFTIVMRERMDSLVQGFWGVYRSNPNVVYLTAAVVAAAGLFLCFLMRLFCCAVTPAQAPSNKKKPYKKMD